MLTIETQQEKREVFNPPPPHTSRVFLWRFSGDGIPIFYLFLSVSSLETQRWIPAVHSSNGGLFKNESPSHGILWSTPKYPHDLVKHTLVSTPLSYEVTGTPGNKVMFLWL